MSKRLQVFTQLPPEDADAERVTRPHIGEHELEGEGQLIVALVCRRGEFEESKNMVYAIEALLIALDLGLYPPPWALKALGAGFKRWHESNGRMPLEQALGLRSSGRGKRDPAFMQVLLKERDEMLAVDCARLVALGASLDAAAVAVAERLKRSDWNESPWKLRPLESDAIKRRYRALSDSLKDAIAERTKSWSPAERGQFLALFPAEHRPRIRGAKTRFSRPRHA